VRRRTLQARSRRQESGSRLRGILSRLGSLTAAFVDELACLALAVATRPFGRPLSVLERVAVFARGFRAVAVISTCSSRSSWSVFPPVFAKSCSKAIRESFVLKILFRVSLHGFTPNLSAGNSTVDAARQTGFASAVWTICCLTRPSVKISNYCLRRGGCHWYDSHTRDTPSSKLIVGSHPVASWSFE
jgi:hypothetical protein